MSVPDEGVFSDTRHMY